MIFKKNTRGLSGVIITIILILLALVLAAIVWNVVDNLVSDKLDQAESCFGILDKVTLEGRYTCYNFPGASPLESDGQIRIAINQGDIYLDEIIVSVSGDAGSKSFTLEETANIINNVWPYSGSQGDAVQIPGENSGTTYIYDWNDQIIAGNSAPQSIQIAAVVNGNQCEISDSLTDIISCNLLT